MLLQLTLFSSAAPAEVMNFTSVFDALLKILFIIGGLLYLVFSFVVMRQIHVMKSTLMTPFSPVIQILGFVHLLLTLGVLFFFITTL